MTDTVAIDLEGGVTSPLGFQPGAVFAGMKTFGEGKLDVALLLSDSPCTVAATFTRNRLRSASIDVNLEKLSDGHAQAVVVNAGIANSSTGQRGIDDARTVTDWAAARLGVPADDVLICSTGVIGHFLPMKQMEAGVNAVTVSPLGGADFARAIMTTDTRPKQASVRFGEYTIGGCAKGSGMIHPNMATMLAFLTTDAPIEQGFLQKSLSGAVDDSFNLLSIDGDTSPSDTVFLLANGKPGGDEIDANSSLAGPFREALNALCIHLAKEMARDGEGATKVIEVTVTGAASRAEAAQLIREMTTSYLVKSAVNGGDPNWGRIVAVIGRSTVQIDEPSVTVSVCGICVFEFQQPTPFEPDEVSDAMMQDTVTIEVHLGAGDAQATGWGCDLSAEYVHINADYHT